jgi:thymidylate synthase (FAD)
VVNNARVSFDKESLELTQGDHRLIGYLARGCTQQQWENMVQELKVTGETQDIIDILNHVKRMPEHWAPFANGVGMRFRVKAPIPNMRQLFKHKVGSVESEVSRRYVSDEPEVFYPTWRKAADNVKQGSGDTLSEEGQHRAWYDYERVVTAALNAYNNMIEDGVCPEQARFVLPQGVYTEAIISNSLYGWANVYNQRSDRKHAQGETADIADAIAERAGHLFPVSWAALTR